MAKVSLSYPLYQLTNDVHGTKRLLQEIVKQNYRPHFIYISIVGTDQLSMPYFRQKFQVEEEIKKSGV
ncbi:MAG: hypothetical protein ABI168_04330, partial [Ginsengibacter sp.]